MRSRTVRGVRWRTFQIAGVALALFGPTAWAQAPTPASGSEPPETAAREPDAALVRECMFVVELGYPQDRRLTKPSRTSRVQPGFLLEPGLGITALSGLVHAERRSIQRPGVRGSLRFDVLGADPALDLAVVRLSEPGAKAREASAVGDAAAPPAPCLGEDSDAELLLDPEHATLWLDLAGGSGERAIPMAELLDASDPSAPLLRPAPLAGSLGGFPIVDSAGRLVGLWQWTWADDEPVTPRVVPASELRALVAKAKETADGFSLEQLGRAWIPSYTPPILSWAFADKEKASNAVRRAKDLRKKLRCPDCDGRGSRPYENRDARGRVIEKGETPCKDCAGERVVGSDARWTALRELATLLTLVPPADDLERVAQSLEEGLRDAADLNLDALLHSAPDGGKEELALANLVPGRAIVFLLPREHWPSQDETLWGERVRVVRTPACPAPLLLRAPFARSTIAEGYAAFLTAVVAGPLTVDGETFVVLDRALVVPVPSGPFRSGR